MKPDVNPFKVNPGIRDRVQLKGVLSDLYADDKRKINTIIAAYDAGIVRDINTSDILDTRFISKWISILTNDFGLSNESASMSVLFWVEKYGSEILGKPHNISPVLENTTIIPPREEDASDIGFSFTAISVEEMKKGDKVPKDHIELILKEASIAGIISFRCAARKGTVYDTYCLYRITGEYEGSSDRYLLIMVMVYNEQDELIGASFRETIGDEFKGKATFETSIQIPNDESISKMIVRVHKNPVFS